MDAKFFDGLFEGDSANGIRLGMGLTGGDFWPRCSGCENLYRGGSVETVDFRKLLAVSEVAAGQISPPNWVQHQADETYLYVVRRVNGCGDEEQTFGGAVKVSFDSQGDLSQPKCNSVFNATVRQFEGDRIECVWFYEPIEQQAIPAQFKVYWDNGCGEIDYENEIGQVEYVGRRFYSWRSGALSEDRYLLCIRAVTSKGVQDGYMGQITIDMNTAAPVGAEIIETVVV